MSYKIGSKCAVYGCNNYKQQKESKSFFRMPKNVDSLKAWIKACNKKSLDDLLKEKEADYFYFRYLICSDHFEMKCFRNQNLFSQGLWPGSIPTLNLYGVAKKRSSDKIDNKRERKSLDVIDGKRKRNSLDVIDSKPGKKSLDEIDNNLNKSYAFQEVMLEEMDLKPKEVILLKLSKGSCIFCGRLDELRNLQSNNTEDCKAENYLQMFLSCFSIKLIDPSGTGGLCGTCVSRLGDAISFRAQVEAAGALLQRVKEEPTTPYSPEQQPTIEDNSSTCQIADDVDTTFTYADCNASSVPESRQILEITWSEDEEAGRREGRVEWIDQIPKYPEVKSFEPKLSDATDQCTVCNMVFAERFRLQRHFEIHLPKFLCEICGRQFNHMRAYKGHLGIHLPENRVSCPQCNSSLASKSGLIAHIKAKHQGRKLYRCPKCGDRFGHLYHRNEHLLKKHGVSYDRHVCPECSLVCHTALRLNKHTRSVHRQEKNAECPECDKVFYSNQNLKNHLKTHSEERNFMCDICGKAFKSRVGIVKHMKMHYDIRSNPCPLCDAAFIQTSSLKCHVRMHHKNVALIKKRTRKNAISNEPEIIYTITFHQDEGTKVKDVIM